MNVIPAHQLPEALKNLASQDEVFSAMATAFAVRERTRNIITIQRLMKNMKDHGFSYTRQNYREVLKKLQAMGVGRLAVKNGKIRALTDINVTLMSIGQAALGQTKALTKAKATRKYTKLAQVSPKITAQLSKDKSNPLSSVSVSQEGIVFQFSPKSNLEDTISAAVGIYKTMSRRGTV